MRPRRGPKPQNRHRPKPTPEAPKCPSWLSRSAKREFKALVADVEAAGTLAVSDAKILAAGATAAAELREAEEALEREGRIVTLPNGIRTPNPWMKVRDSAARRLDQALRALGLSPRARSTLVVNPPDEPDDLDALLGRRHRNRLDAFIEEGRS